MPTAVIFEFLRRMELIDMLTFGATNTRLHAAVQNEIDKLNNQFGSIQFDFSVGRDCNSIGLHPDFHRRFISSVIDMDLFHQFDGTLIPFIRNLSISLELFSIDDPYHCRAPAPNHSALLRFQHFFQIAGANVLNNIQQSHMPALRQLQFSCLFHFDEPTFEMYHRHWQDSVTRVAQSFFLNLRRGSLSVHFFPLEYPHSPRVSIEINY